MGIKNIGERTGLLCKLSEKKGAGQTYFDENGKTQERKDLWEVWAASLADALQICREKVEGGTEGSWTYCSLEDKEGGLPYMQDHPHPAMWIGPASATWCDIPSVF